MDGGILLIELGDEAREIYVSPSFCRLMRLDYASYRLPKPLSEAGIHPDDLAGYEAALRKGAADNAVVDYTFRDCFDGEAWYWRHCRAVRIAHESAYPVMIAVITDITEHKKLESELIEGNERLRCAFDQTEQMLWEVDIEGRTFSIWDIEHQGYLDNIVFKNVPDSLIDGDWVHPEYRARFRDFFKGMFEGRSEDSGAFIVRYFRNREYGWSTLSYHMIYDDRGAPKKAIGVSRDLPYAFNEQSGFMREERFSNAVSAYVTSTIRVNLSEDAIQSVYGGAIDGATGEIGTYTGYAAAVKGTILGDHDAALFDARLSRDALLSAYKNGADSVEMEYRCRAADGTIRWHENAMALIMDPVSGALFGFGYIRDIDARKQWEMELPVRAERDAATLLYTRETTAAIMDAVIEARRGEAGFPALAVFVINGLEGAVDALGIAAEGQAMSAVSRLFRMVFDAETIVGLAGKHSVMVFLPRAPSFEEAEAYMQGGLLGLERLQSGLGVPGELHFSMGVSIAAYADADPKRMFAAAAASLAHNGAGRRNRLAGGKRPAVNQLSFLSP